jgi:hypothetical protein
MLQAENESHWSSSSIANSKSIAKVDTKLLLWYADSIFFSFKYSYNKTKIVFAIEFKH